MFACLCCSYEVLDICMLASFLLKQMYKQDVGPNVSTCWYNITACLISQSWKICFKREITEDFIKNMIHVDCCPRSVCF